MSEGKGLDHLWAKTKKVFSYVYANYKSQADWFVKADDDTYLIVENLKYMLQAHNTSHILVLELYLLYSHMAAQHALSTSILWFKFWNFCKWKNGSVTRLLGY